MNVAMDRPRTAADWIRRLALTAHPEGGYYRESYRAAEAIPQYGLPPRFPDERRFSAAIYYLLTAGECSRLHRLRADEVWHFYTGQSLTVHVIDPRGQYLPVNLGPHIEHGQHFQVVVPAGHWFGATLDHPEGYALVGCTTAPAFDFADFQLAERASLLAQFPEHRAVIERLTRA